MLRALPHLLGFGLPALIVVSAQLGSAWTVLPLFVVLLVFPLTDALAGLNIANPEDESLSANPWFRLVTWLWVPVQVWFLGWSVQTVSSGRLTPAGVAGLALSTGVTVGTIGITFAHELIHRPGRLERALGEILLATASYTHFAIEHVYGHHRYVGTPRDPATARAGESLYRFIPRSVGGGVASAWGFETERLARRARAWSHPSNRMLRYAATQVVMYAAVGWVWGAGGAAFLAVQAVIAFSLLETINYIEHYGLVRREVAPGRYERVMACHSWNSSYRVSNWLLINLARHSDHHLVASKRYQMLEHLEPAPQLPAGYGAMFLAALCPPVWRRLMDPRVERWRERHLGPVSANG